MVTLSSVHPSAGVGAGLLRPLNRCRHQNITCGGDEQPSNSHPNRAILEPSRARRSGRYIRSSEDGPVKRAEFTLVAVALIVTLFNTRPSVRQLWPDAHHLQA